MPLPPRSDQRRQVLERLRAELARLDGQAAGPGPGRCLPLGLAALDRALPGGGLARVGIHELCGVAEQAVLGLAAVLLGRFARLGPAIWIRPQRDLYGPGLAELGLAPDRLVVVRAGPREARLWALEEVLRTPGIGAGLSAIDRLSLTQSRRLQLAAEAGGTAAFLLRPAQALMSPSAALTRWRVAPLARDGAPPQAVDLAPPSWRLELVRCRGGATGVWRIEWQNGGFHELADPVAVAAPSRDRPDRARRA